MRRFILRRHEDVSGVSGTGIVCEGVRFSDGSTVVRWLSAHPSTEGWDSVEACVEVHGHDGKTVIEWLDDNDSTCFHRPDPGYPCPECAREST